MGREGASAWCFLGPVPMVGARGDRGSPLGLSQLLCQGAGMLPTNSSLVENCSQGQWFLAVLACLSALRPCLCP